MLSLLLLVAGRECLVSISNEKRQEIHAKKSSQCQIYMLSGEPGGQWPDGKRNGIDAHRPHAARIKLGGNFIRGSASENAGSSARRLTRR